MPKKYTVGDLRKDMEIAENDDELVIIFSDEDNEDEVSEVEDGDVLDVLEAGGYVRGMRTILVKPRG